ncbi:BgTH12-01341 [Blumeria graminis f. sp. triticale]|uniref:Bgt-5135 n=3 Tax=Blumeria graminis TaxID=34373 RepID=A0A061HJW6_BLUGR|nr:hypothetical protein BGT96224_5135 [Blumeria graminis f. sp. tritici 96224]CAD6505854.1 BgTH12-01341 [Blumeria graminis f. sp. triticale]VDB94025.1 Bgt-5135 [Blumeria graminis f. sp. tritici]
MSLYSEPPSARSFRDDKPTLLVCWWCTIFAMVIILFRVCGRYVRTEKLFREDWIAFSCIIPLLFRMAFVHVVLLYGTNNTTVSDISEQDIYRRSLGSKFVLVSRFFYAATLWTLKLTISEFFKRLTWSITTFSHDFFLRSIRWLLLITFVIVIIADVSECRSFSGYWQVIPDPGPQCRQGYAQLLSMGTCNIITDLLLVIFPIPIIIKSKMKFKRKLQLVLLFSMSLLPVATTLYRLPHIIDRRGSQQYRSLLASVEILFATAVANALVLGSFVRDRGVKKPRFKLGSTSESVERAGSFRGHITRQWGSDEDLVRDMGLSMDPQLREKLATRRSKPGKACLKAHRIMGNDWECSEESRDTRNELVTIKVEQPNNSSLSPFCVITPRRVSFFDVGGLLDDDQPKRLRQTSEYPDKEVVKLDQDLSPLKDENVTSSCPRTISPAFLRDAGSSPRYRNEKYR